MGDAEGELKKAPRRESLRLTIQRGGGEAMETRGILALYDQTFDHLTVYSSTQSPHLIRQDLAFLLSRPESSIDVIAPDVGGGFGPKAYTYPEDLVVPWLALELGCPVKWIEDRLEHIQTTLQEREQVHEVEFGFDGEGHLLSLRVRAVSDIGAYVPWGIVVPLLTITNIPGPYQIRHYGGLMDVAYTHRVPIAPVRGAGRPQSTFVIERVMDRMAEVLGLDPTEVRYRNFIQPEDFPYETGIRSRDGTMLVYDSGDYPRLLRLALERANYAAFRRGEHRPGEEGDPSAGRYVGIGMSCNVEMTGTGPFEGARVRIDPSGKVFLATGAAPQGQGHETVLAQVLADVLGVSPEDVTVVTGDTRAIPYGVGTFASRTAVTASGAVINAGRAVREKVLTLAAERLEVRWEDLEMAGGAVFVKGAPDRKVSLGELARYSIGPAPGMMHRSKVEAGLEATELFAPSMAATAYGAHVAVVEVDAETGFVRVLRYVAGHDCGRLINPLLVEGQMHGGVVHGIGDALIEEVVFDEGGQPLASTFLDYFLPLATDVPWMEVVHIETPSPFNPAGVKGAGEAGTIAAPAAIANAIADALRPLGVEINELPLTPYRLRRLIEQAAQAKKS
jgi:CO/xanthine dehydrogenase Mo-binding subunit